MSGQLTLDREDGASVSPPTHADLGNQPPEPQCRVAIGEHEPCRLKYGCMLLAHGTMCGPICFARITSY